MCFHGRSNSLAACDSGAGLEGVSTADVIEPDVMNILQNRNIKRLLPTFYKSHFGRNESLIKAVPFRVTARCKQSALQEPEFLNIMLCSRRLFRRAHSG